MTLLKSAAMTVPGLTEIGLLVQPIFKRLNSRSEIVDIVSSVEGRRDGGA